MTDHPLSSLAVARKSGQERFHFSGEPATFNLLDFWQWSASDLASNALRGRLAEFLVARALGVAEGVRAEWDAYDLRTLDATTIEVKSAAYIQTWTQRQFSTIQFGISPTRSWDAESNVFETDSRRQADVYVFALLAHQEKKSIDPLNIDQWKLFVLPTSILNERVPAQKQVRLSRLLELGAVESSYEQLANAIGLAATNFKTRQPPERGT